MAIITNSFQELNNSFYVYIPWKGDKNVDCPHCNGTGPFWTNKYYWREVNHAHVDGKLVYNVEIAYVQCQACLKFFGIQPDGFIPYKRTTERSINLIIDTYKFDDLSISQLKKRLERDFHLELSEKTLENLINENMKEPLPAVDNSGIKYSGVICIDGMHGKTNGVDDVTIFAIDPIFGTTFQGQIRSSESNENIRPFLSDLKMLLPHDPFLIITDFVEWDGEIKEVFPNTLLQKCHFHLMKHVTKGIKKELSQYVQEHYGRKINEMKEISRQTLELEKKDVLHDITLNPQSSNGRTSLKLANHVIRVAQLPPPEREEEIDNLVSTAINSGEETLKSLGETVLKKKKD